jgi:hypothetical protein
MIKDKNILTVDDLIDYTDFSQKQIYKLTSTRAIPHYKPRGRIDSLDELNEKII